MLFLNLRIKKNLYKFVVASNKISKDLENWGMVLGKDFKTYFPPIEEKYWSHFIRGVFDGDGCISIYKSGQPMFYITGNGTFIKQIQDILISKCNLSANLLRPHANNLITKTLAFGGKKQIKRIRDFLYFEENGFSIERKRIKIFNL